jgi:serine/threonine-protein kinase
MAGRREKRGTLKAGDVIGGKYRVERLLGEGGMGMVVAAHHVMLDQPVAVKLLYSDDEEAVSRLVIEAKSCARIPGEHVSRVLDIDRGPDGLPFIVMELLEGVDLYQVLASQGPLPRWLVTDYVLQSLMGLAGAHARGIVHRDLKPSNLFLARRPDGSQIIKVLDFGVSKSILAAEVDQSLTGAKAMLGSPPYMSPEQVRSPKTVDTRADIWAMGIVMYELLTGRLPYRGAEIQETFALILEREVPPLRDFAPEVPQGMETAILKCLTKNREERWQSVAELAKALVPFGSGTWTHAADEIRKTLTRPVAEDTNPSRSRSGSGPLIASRRLDADVQPTASTVIGKRKFQLSSEGSRIPMIITGLITTGAILFIIALLIRSRANAAAAADMEQDGLPQAAQVPIAPVPVPMPATAPQAPLQPQGITQMGQPTNGGLVQTGAPHAADPAATYALDDGGVRAPPSVVVAPPYAVPTQTTAPKKWRQPQSPPGARPQPQPQPKNNGGGALPSELLDQK